MAKEERKSLEDYFRISFTYTSNALEGNTLTISETKILLEDGITVGGCPLKDCYEAVGHGAAYDFMLELARQQDMIITEETIKKLHRLFYQKVDADQAGQYRSVQVYISGSEYIPPAPEEVPRLMNHLTDQIHSSKHALHPIELAAMTHKRLVDIHPFIHGNVTQRHNQKAAQQRQTSLYIKLNIVCAKGHIRFPCTGRSGSVVQTLIFGYV